MTEDEIRNLNEAIEYARMAEIAEAKLSNRTKQFWHTWIRMGVRHWFNPNSNVYITMTELLGEEASWQEVQKIISQLGEDIRNFHK